MQNKRQAKGRWWMLSAIGLFILGKGKMLLALLKFSKFGGAILSMLVTMGAYAVIFPLWFSVTFVLLILFHEMGHVWAAKQKGLPVTAPVFIPFLGALIMLKQNPRDAVTEAYVGMGGPLVGTFAAAGALVLGIAFDWPAVIAAANFAFIVNLFNLVPIHPLDGGRIAVAITRWLWVVGIVGGLAIIIYFQAWILFIFWLLFVFELGGTYLRRRGAGKPYAQSARVELPLGPLLEQGMLIPGESHQRDLPVMTYSTLDGTQWVEIHWDAMNIHEKASLPKQSIVKRVRVNGVKRIAERQEPTLAVYLLVEAVVHVNDRYFEVPARARVAFGAVYVLLAVALGLLIAVAHRFMQPL